MNPITYDDSGTTYDNLGVGYGGFTVSPALGYSVVLRDFVDANNGSFGPGDVILFIDNPTNLAWTEYVNEVGEAFFTLSQSDQKMLDLVDIDDLVNRRVHMQILRNGETVWGGWLGELDETSEDMILYGYSYLSGLYDLLTGWNESWTGENISTIVSELWADAKAKTDSRVGWMRTGTIENPVTTSGGSTGLTLPLYKASYKRTLTALKELAAYSISDTTNQVVFEITPNGEFNFWKNKKRTVSDVRASWGHGQVRSYRRIRRPVHRRSKLLAVGASPTSVNLQSSQSDATLQNDMGLSEEPLFFSFVRDQDELDRVTKLRLARAKRVDNELYLSFYRDTLVPFRAAGEDYRIGDIINPEFEHGTSFVSTDDKMIAGQQVIYTGKRENVRILLADRL